MTTAPTQKKIRTVFFGTPEIAEFFLRRLLDSEVFEVVGVVSQPDRPAGRKMQLQPSPVKATAQAHNLDVVTPEKVTADVIEKVRSWNADVAIVVAFGQLLPQAFLDVLPGKVVNVHTSLLPRWRGAAPVQRAIMAGDSETGVCLQVMVKKLDAGDVIASHVLKIDDEMTAVTALDSLGELGYELIESKLPAYLDGKVKPSPQDESQVTYAHKIDKSESQLDWNQPARTLHNKIRGMTLGPGTFTYHKGKKLKIHTTRIVDENKTGSPGSVVKAGESGIEVECSSGRLLLVEVQPESKPKMKARDYLLGNPMSAGDKLG